MVWCNDVTLWRHGVTSYCVMSCTTFTVWKAWSILGLCHCDFAMTCGVMLSNGVTAWRHVMLRRDVTWRYDVTSRRDIVACDIMHHVSQCEIATSTLWDHRISSPLQHHWQCDMQYFVRQNGQNFAAHVWTCSLQQGYIRPTNFTNSVISSSAAIEEGTTIGIQKSFAVIAHQLRNLIVTPSWRQELGAYFSPHH